MEGVLLHVLTVIALAVVEAEEALLEDGILAVPERQCEAQPLIDVAETGDAVFAPAEGRLRAWSCGKLFHALPSTESSSRTGPQARSLR